MREHRETEMILKQLSRLESIGKVFFVVFLLCAIFFLFMFVLTTTLIAFDSSANPTAVVHALPVFAQNIALGSTFLMCALISKGISTNQTPFSSGQIHKVIAAGCIMLAYTIFCTLFPTIYVYFQPESIGLTLETFPGTEPGDLNINFEPFIAACSFFLFAYILNYGKTLQELSDETL